MASRLCDALGLVAEQRAEGLALTDESGQLTDVAMPAEGTEAHAIARSTDIRAFGPATALVLRAPMSDRSHKHIPAAATTSAPIDAFRKLRLINVRRNAWIELSGPPTGAARRFTVAFQAWANTRVGHTRGLSLRPAQPTTTTPGSGAGRSPRFFE